MRTINRKGALAGVLGGVSMCALAMSAMAQSKGGLQNPAMEQIGDPVLPFTMVRGPVSPITGNGGIAGLSPIIHDNGSAITPGACNPSPVCAPPGTQSTLQNAAPLGLNVFGFTANATFQIADDFTLTGLTDLQQIEFEVYNTGAVGPTVSAASVTLHADAAGTVGAPVPGCGPTATMFSPVTMSTTYRSLPATACNRIHQHITMDVSSWPDLPAGTYWVSMQATAPAGPFMTPVVICDACGKPGANAFQFNAGVWNPLNDTGVGGCAATPRQDVPFIVRGDAVGGPTCDGDADGDGDTDVDDLIAVILDWGCVGAPGVCNGDVNNSGATDVDDLIAVILDWGCT
jgi:hypothetical protein